MSILLDDHRYKLSFDDLSTHHSLYFTAEDERTARDTANKLIEILKNGSDDNGNGLVVSNAELSRIIGMCES